MLSLYVSEDSSQRTRITIDNTIYYIILKYSTREKSWYLSIEDVNSVEIQSGTKLQELSVLNKYTTSTFNGIFSVLRNNETSAPIGRNNLGQDKDYSLVFISLSELV